MKETKGKDSKDSGNTFEANQRAMDTALNEKEKEEKGTDKLDSQADQNSNRSHKTDVSRKKTGGGHQSSPGD